MTYAGSFGLSRSGIVVRQGDIVLRAPGDAGVAGGVAPQAEESDLRGLLREVVAIRRAGKKR